MNTTLLNIYTFYHYSPLNMCGHLEIGESLNIVVLKPTNEMEQDGYPISRSRALKAVDWNWECLIKHIGEVAATSKTDVGLKIDGKSFT